MPVHQKLPRRVPSGWVCFDRGPNSRALPHVAPLRLSDRSATALAELLPLLLCGEESAALAFGGVAGATLAPAVRADLERIRAEEVVHGDLLQSLQAALPDAQPDSALRARTRRFFITLADRDPGRYFARIAGLDSAVCVLLAALRGKHSSLDAETTVTKTFARIHRDEAGHVDAARRIALACLPVTQAIDVATQTRQRLVELLRERGAAFDQLGVDPELLFVRLGSLPRGLFK